MIEMCFNHVYTPSVMREQVKNPDLPLRDAEIDLCVKKYSQAFSLTHNVWNTVKAAEDE